ncbi:MAG: PaaI family thioesterase [Chloroflexi bacterium]|nr:PaaI family thioesterase [Chloroflexota bacterium]
MNVQPSSRQCFLCGVENPIGLKLSFYELGDGRVATRFLPQQRHQGYPGVLHGGIASALLDETIGRTLTPLGIWAMTVELNVRYHKPIPLREPVIVIGEMVRLRSRMMEGKGEIRLNDGSIAASAQARYVRLTAQQTDTYRSELGYWDVIEDDQASRIETERALQRILEE